jgi:hypothetical protein
MTASLLLHTDERSLLSAPSFTLPQYRRSRAALGDAPEIQAIAAALEAAALHHPHSGLPVPGTAVHILRANRTADSPPVRLYYCVAGAGVHFLWVEEYDEMEE